MESNTLIHDGIMFTGDWHCGVRIKEVKRDNEMRAVLSEMTDKITEAHPSYLVILGDLTEQPTYPGMEPARMIGETLAELNSRLPDMKIFIIKGNHDWEGVGLFGISKKNNIFMINEPKAIELEHGLYLLAVPYLKKFMLDNMKLPEEQRSYNGIFSVLRNAVPDDAHCLGAAHISLEGTVPGMTEAGLTRSVMDMDIEKMFLGHIHQHRALGDEIYYTGSIIRNTFGEENEKSGMWYLQPDGRLRDIELTSPRHLYNIVFDDPSAVADGRLEKKLTEVLMSDPEALIKIKVLKGRTYDDQIVEIAEHAEELYSSKGHNVVMYDYSTAKDTIMPEMTDDAILSSDEQHADMSDVISEKISLKQLWHDYCADRLNEDQGIGRAEAEVVETCGEALMDDCDINDIWSAMKSGHYNDIKHNDKDNKDNKDGNSMLSDIKNMKDISDLREKQKLSRHNSKNNKGNKENNNNNDVKLAEDLSEDDILIDM